MLQNKFEMPLDLIVKPSRLFSLYLYLVLFFSVISIFVASLSVAVQFFLLSGLVLSFVVLLNNYNINKVTSFKLSTDDDWEIEINNKNTLDAELCGECIVTSFLVWLNFKTCKDGENKRYHLLLLPDSADKELLRRLRVRLRFLKNLNNENLVI